LSHSLAAVLGAAQASSAVVAVAPLRGARVGGVTVELGVLHGSEDKASSGAVEDFSKPIRERRGLLLRVVEPDEPAVALGREPLLDAHLEHDLERRAANLADAALDGDLLVEVDGRAVVDVALGEDEPERLALGPRGRVPRG